MLDTARLHSEILISVFVRSCLCERNFIVVLILRLNKMNVVIEGNTITKSMKLSKISILNVYFSLMFYRIPMNHTFVVNVFTKFNGNLYVPRCCFATFHSLALLHFMLLI